MLLAIALRQKVFGTARRAVLRTVTTAGFDSESICPRRREVSTIFAQRCIRARWKESQARRRASADRAGRR